MNPKYHIHAVKFDIHRAEDDGLLIECPDDDPYKDCFGLYERQNDGTLDHISDHETRAAAEAAAEKIDAPTP